VTSTCTPLANWASLALFQPSDTGAWMMTHCPSGGAHPRRQGGERGADLAAGEAVWEGLGRCGWLGEFGYVALSPPTGAANLIDVGVDDNSPDVGGLGTASPDLRPGDVEPGQGRLDQVFGEMSVPGRQQAGRTNQPGAPGLDERGELFVAR
jgi:hypothetical protein